MRYLYPVIVGEMVTIGHNATVHGCVLEDAVLVGIGATILNNARIGEGSIIAAGAVIPEQTIIPPNSLVAGVPGKIRRTLGDDDRALILKYAQIIWTTPRSTSREKTVRQLHPHTYRAAPSSLHLKLRWPF